LILFAPLPVCEVAMLEEGVGDHRQGGMPTQLGRGSALNVLMWQPQPPRASTR
jgi:hypothetical protein